jgi:hypothetical protein
MEWPPVGEGVAAQFLVMRKERRILWSALVGGYRDTVRRCDRVNLATASLTLPRALPVAKRRCTFPAR